MYFRRTLLLVVTLITLAACAGSEEAATSPGGASEGPTQQDTGEDMEMGSEGAHTDGEFAFGRPADAAEADRTIDIRTSNELAFDPAQVTVAAGETVTFSISNEGDLQHDFVLGDEAAQEEHADEMAAMESEMAMEGEEHGDANALSIPPGETVELTWVFDGETEGLLYGCHEPGHYEAGMVGEIIVEG